MEFVQPILTDPEFESVRPNYKTDPRKIQIFRSLVAIIMLINNFIYVFNEGETGFLNFLFFLTHWGNIFTTSYFTLNSFMYYDRKMTSKLALFYHVAFTTELMVTCGFWSIAMPMALMTFQDSPRKLKYLGSTSKAYQIYMNIYLHSFPLLCLWIDYWFNRFVLSKKSLRLWISVVVTYSLINYFAVVVFDYEIYVSIDYSETKHFIIVLGLILSSLIIWYFPLWYQHKKFVLKEKMKEQHNALKS